MLRRKYPHARFDLVGPPDASPGRLSPDDVDTWVADGRLAWHGAVDDVRPWIDRCTVYVLPSYREGKPRSTQEAMAMARAIVTTDAPGCRDTVVEGANGFKVPVGDSAGLAHAMERFIVQPGLARTMGAASRTFAEQQFDVNVVNGLVLAELGIAPALRTDGSLLRAETVDMARAC